MDPSQHGPGGGGNPGGGNQHPSQQVPGGGQAGNGPGGGQAGNGNQPLFPGGGGNPGGWQEVAKEGMATSQGLWIPANMVVAIQGVATKIQVSRCQEVAKQGTLATSQA